MSPALVSFLLPIVSGLLSLLGAGPVEEFLVQHAITFIAGHIARYVRLDESWGLNVSISDPATGTVAVTISRDGRTAIVLVFEPLGLTAAHQSTIAALLGALFQEGEAKLLAAFKGTAPTGGPKLLHPVLAVAGSGG